MARPPSISNRQILDAARAVFLASGLQKASTAEIARRAGVSEGSIFNRFATKDALFRAAMDEAQSPVLTVSRFVGAGDVRKNLITITVESIHFLGQLLPKLMLRWSTRSLACGAKVSNRPREILRALTSFFEQERALARVACDPEIAARIFMGAVWNYCFLQTVAADRSMSPQTFARRLVAALWQGIAPRRKPA
jgi:AcrR family transcriptional regulator